ncbi:regulatory protein RecX [Jatrophihabitans sp. DSM 45814]
MARLSTAAGADSAPPGRGTHDLPPDIAADPDANPESVAHNICLRLLTFRDRTRSELADALAAKQVPTEVAVRVLDRLAAVGLLDDRAFAATFAQVKQRERGLSAREIVRQLRSKGVDAEVAEAAVSALGVESEIEVARDLVERKLKTMGRLDAETKTRRLVAMLARKGYSSGVAYSLVRAALGAEAATAESDFENETAWLA